MPRVSTYLNFSQTTEEAFKYYRSVFGGEFSGRGIHSMFNFDEKSKARNP
jgi:PhnB protein